MIPRLQTSNYYFQAGALTAFITIMMWAIALFFAEYREAEVKKKQAQLEIVQLTEQPKSVDAGPVKDSKIEIDAGLVKIAMSNEASWTAIIKMVSTVLFTFFGIKLINLVFRRLDTNSQ